MTQDTSGGETYTCPRRPPSWPPSPAPSAGGPNSSSPGQAQFRIWRCRPGSRSGGAPGLVPSGLSFGPVFQSLHSLIGVSGAAEAYGYTAPREDIRRCGSLAARRPLRGSRHKRRAGSPFLLAGISPLSQATPSPLRASQGGDSCKRRLGFERPAPQPVSPDFSAVLPQRGILAAASNQKQARALSEFCAGARLVRLK